MRGPRADLESRVPSGLHNMCWIQNSLCHGESNFSKLTVSQVVGRLLGRGPLSKKCWIHPCVSCSCHPVPEVIAVAINALLACRKKSAIWHVFPDGLKCFLPSYAR